MRTKQTGGKAAPEMNGNAKARPEELKSPAPTSTPTEPQLSESDTQRLKLWLDNTEKPFSVSTVPLSKKRKRDPEALQVQDDLWEDRLSVQYEVKPRDKWESLRRYKRFTVFGSESIETGQCILVEHGEWNDAKFDLASQWKAKVLEVRALDSEHVFIRVAWLNRPEDLCSGRKEYHGKNELIPTNQMDVIDAMTCNGSLEVVHWDDMGDEILPVSDDEFFWRQTYDFTTSHTFSKLRMICIDHKPQNPDRMILQCPSEECGRWLHVECIAEQAVQRAADRASSTKLTPKKMAQPRKLSPKSPPVATATIGGFTSEVFINAPPDIPDDATESEIVITNANGDQHAEELRCLHCGSNIND